MSTDSLWPSRKRPARCSDHRLGVRLLHNSEGKPDLVVAFPGGRGTADMVKRARAAGVEVIEVDGPDGG